MGLFGCFTVILPSKWRNNKIQPIFSQDCLKVSFEINKDAWKSLISTSYSSAFWNNIPHNDRTSINKETVISKSGGLSFDINLGTSFDILALKDLDVDRPLSSYQSIKKSFDIFAIPKLPPKRFPPINREDIESLKRPKRIKRKGRGKKSKLTVDEKLANAKARRERAESEKREKTLRKLKMVPE